MIRDGRANDRPSAFAAGRVGTWPVWPPCNSWLIGIRSAEGSHATAPQVGGSGPVQIEVSLDSCSCRPGVARSSDSHRRRRKWQQSRRPDCCSRTTTKALSMVSILWPDGERESVRVSGQPSDELLESTVVERARATGRKPVGSLSRMTTRRRQPGRPSPRTTMASGSATYGATACGWTIYSPYKISAMRVKTNSAANCTTEVYSIVGTIYLFRSANYTLIGQSTSSGGSQTAPVRAKTWATTGTCLSSTWQYNAELWWCATSAVNGSACWGPMVPPTSWISC